jgi:hypothetical protein
MRQGIFWFSGIFLLIMYFLFTPALAHVPVFGGEGKTPETAIQIEDPSKSRVFYGQLASGDIIYYSFKIEKGEKIVLGLTIPVEQGNQGFSPYLILIGPGLKDEGKNSEKLEVPKGDGTKVLSCSLPDSPVYEGFTPAAFYSVAHFDIKAPESGIYYAVVGMIPEISMTEGESKIHEKDIQEKEIRKEGNYGLILGYKETFTLKEWISVPLSQIKIYLWEGQSLLLVFSPLLLTLIVGFLVIFFKRETVSGFYPENFSGILAGLFFLGTGVTYIFQMLISLSKSSYSYGIIVTLFLILISIGLGVAAIVLSFKEISYIQSISRMKFYYFILGIIGLLFWAGWFIGSFFAFETVILLRSHNG